jgi:predicted AAA+ superfamily ATPase
MINLAKYNFHWREGFSYGYDVKRGLFEELVKYADAKPVVGVVGLRRTGKTVLLKQLIDYLVENKVKRERILYFSFDEAGASLEKVISEYQARLGVELAKAGNGGKLYIFLDEVQKLEGWQEQLKYYYDSFPDLKFFISGSSSLFLKQKAEESLAGRIFLFHLPVLSFREFLVLKGEGELAEKPELFKELLKEQVMLYVRRQFPELVNADEGFIHLYADSIVNKAVYEDLPKIFPIEYEDLLKRILYIVASNPGMITDYESLANDLGISRITLTKYISYLERGFLLQKCYNFSRNLLTSEKKTKRLYLTSSSLVVDLWEEPEFGRVVENLVVSSSGAKFFWRSGKDEVDCVLVRNGEILPIECKYRSNIRKRDLKGLLKFLTAFELSHGYVISEDIEFEEIIEDKKISIIPLWKWLLNF